MRISYLLLALLTVPAFAARPPFTTDDLWGWRAAGDPRISPDGRWVAYTETWNDRAANARFSNIWLDSTDGRERRQITNGNWHDRLPRWSPDSTRLAWVSDRGGTGMIFVRTMETGADARLAELESPPLGLVWSPEGNFVAFTARVANAAKPPAWAPPAILPRLRAANAASMQIFVIPAAGGAPRQVSRGDFDAVGEPSWMLDSRSMVAARSDGQIWSIQVEDGSAKQMTHEPGRNESPIVSSEGNRIAWLCTRDTDQSYATRKLCVMNADGSRLRVLSGSLDRDVTDPQWSSDSRTVYFVADDRGATHVYAARNDGTVRQATTVAERLTGFSLADNGRAASIRFTPGEAGEVYTFTVDHVTQPVTLASPNDHLLAEREIGATEELRYQSGGQEVQAWVVKPPGFDPTRKYPLLVDVRDDPRAMCGVEFNLRAQIAAARGFVELCVNPRGTPGYGEVFGNLLHTSYPGEDYDDLMRGVDAVLAKGYIDPQRLTLAGGLLAAWAIGHTDRFRAVVARRPIVDWAVDVAVAPDGLRRARAWLGAMPWADPDLYTKHSPLFFAANFRTPTLVMASDSDAEAEQLYFALRARKVDCAFVRLPKEPTPANEVAELETMLGWLSR